MQVSLIDTRNIWEKCFIAAIEAI
jgi:hypothetical protein